MKMFSLIMFFIASTAFAADNIACNKIEQDTNARNVACEKQSGAAKDKCMADARAAAPAKKSVQ